jgi:glycosyltransferase involved in cell wall biosynthesis
MDEAAAALDTLRPRVVLTYAEAGGWGRALALEARRRHIPVVGLQHGFIYRHWLNYLHEPDEMAPSSANSGDAGFPRPDLTLVYDGFARAHLIDAGHFPPSTVVVTGSPRLEAFADAGQRLTVADREQVRAAVGAKAGQKLVVLATKFSQIAEWFRPLVEAIGNMPDAHLVVKCHPAETAEPYESVAASVANVRVEGPRSDLGALVACADLIVTVNSTAAIEAMAVEVPGLVLALPNNLSPFVDAGALAGVDDPAEIATTMRRLLYDQAARRSLAEHRRAFIERYDIVSTGGAATRAADAILELAQGPVSQARP